MCNYIVFVNKKKDIVIIDSECDEEIGCKVQPYWDWDTDNEDLQIDEGFNFDVNKAFAEVGVYKVYGYETSCDTPDGHYEGYEVEKVEKISNVNY